jgi:hypothetical protein
VTLKEDKEENIRHSKCETVSQARRRVFTDGENPTMRRNVIHQQRYADDWAGSAAQTRHNSTGLLVPLS